MSVRTVYWGSKSLQMKICLTFGIPPTTEVKQEWDRCNSVKHTIPVPVVLLLASIELVPCVYSNSKES